MFEQLDSLNLLLFIYFIVLRIDASGIEYFCLTASLAIFRVDVSVFPHCDERRAS